MEVNMNDPQYIYYIEHDNFKASSGDQRFKRTNSKNGKSFTGPSQVVLRPNYPKNTILKEELNEKDIVQLKSGKLYRILPLKFFSHGTFSFDRSHVDERQYRGIPLDITYDPLDDTIEFTVENSEQSEENIDKSDVHMVWRNTVPWKSDVRDEAYWLIKQTNPMVPHRIGPPVVCSNPPFDDYVSLLGHTGIDNTTSREHQEYPSAIEMAYNYSEFVGLMPQVEYVNHVLSTSSERSAEGITSTLAVYVTNSEPFNEDGSYYKGMIGTLDKIFENSPPLTKALTVFRKYEIPPDELSRLRPGNLFISDRYVSTSLSLSCLKNAYFTAMEWEKTTPIYCRIDIMPGVHVLPVYDWHGLKHQRVKDQSYMSTVTESAKSEFEIILPRNTRLYKLPEKHTYEIPSELTILNNERVKGGDFPTITHHFVAVADYEEFELQYPLALPWRTLKLGDLSTFSIPININTSESIYEQALLHHTAEKSTYKKSARSILGLTQMSERNSRDRYAKSKKRTESSAFKPYPAISPQRSRSRDRSIGGRKTRRFNIR